MRLNDWLMPDWARLQLVDCATPVVSRGAILKCERGIAWRSAGRRLVRRGVFVEPFPAVCGFLTSHSRFLDIERAAGILSESIDCH
jgi:hypothetical protein